MIKKHQPIFGPENAEIDGEDGVRSPSPSAATRLLVSVRDTAELTCLRDSGVEIIDFKEPTRGPLAPTDPPFWHVAADEVDAWASETKSPSIPLLSAALGESDQALEIANQVPPRFSFAKVGPSGCSSVSALRRTWNEVRSMIGGVELVAVAYADWRNAGCLTPEAIFQEAVHAGMHRCLIDTFVKDGTSTLQHLGSQRLHELSLTARQQGIWWTLAGSIRLKHVAQLVAWGVTPDCIGLRGDVCDRDRTGKVDLRRVSAWRNALDQHPMRY